MTLLRSTMPRLGNNALGGKYLASFARRNAARRSSGAPRNATDVQRALHPIIMDGFELEFYTV